MTLFVKEGPYKPYLYKSSAYKRQDSSTIKVDRLEFNRLILEGKNLTFEQIRSSDQALKFHYLQKVLQSQLNIETISLDILKTLQLYSDNTGYNNATALVADHNNFPGIDSVKIGKTIDILQDRETFANISILQQFDLIIEKFNKYYTYDVVNGSKRETFKLIPEKAFREAIANAIVHRQWDINAHINVAMYDDRIEVTSTGDLPNGIDKQNYLNGGISLARNEILATLFLRINLIERFGTGIRRINESYNKSNIKPIFNISDSTIQVILPVVRSAIDLPKDEQLIYVLLSNTILSSTEISNELGFGKTKVVKLINELLSKGYIKKIGTGRGTKYTSN